MSDIDRQVKQLEVLLTVIPHYKQGRIRGAINSLKDAKRHLEKAQRLKHNIAENCTEHKWPRGRPGGSIRTIGTIEHEQCNNCLAMRITFLKDIRVDNKWVRVTDSKVIESTFDLSSGIDID